jgi:hypothetical protein
MGCFALFDRAVQAPAQQILMLVAERVDADEVAFELRRKGHDVAVREVVDHQATPPPATGSPGRPSLAG